MKAIKLLILSLITFSFSATAQKTEKVVIKTPTIQCGMCKSKIEKTLPRLADGITSVKVDVKAKTTTVTWIKERSSLSMIRTSIANIGYDADDVTADESAYNRLPACCKKPEPGAPAMH